MQNNFKKIQDEVRRATNGVIIKPKTFKKSYLPLIQYYISDRKKKKIKTYVIGVQGCQGVGKTVLTSLLKAYLKSDGYKVAGFSIDDFYSCLIFIFLNAVAFLGSFNFPMFFL